MIFYFTWDLRRNVRFPVVATSFRIFHAMMRNSVYLYCSLKCGRLQNHTANSNTPILMGHGGADFMVPIAFGEMTAAFLKKFNPNVLMKTYPSMPHGSCPEVFHFIYVFIVVSS